MIVSDHKTAAKKQRHKFWRHKLEPEFSRVYFSSGTRVFTRTLEDLNCVGMSAGSRNNLNIYIRTESAPKQAENVDLSHDRRRERDAEVRHGGRGPSRRSGRDQEDLRLQRRAAPSPPPPYLRAPHGHGSPMETWSERARGLARTHWLDVCLRSRLQLQVIKAKRSWAEAVGQELPAAPSASF